MFPTIVAANLGNLDFSVETFGEAYRFRCENPKFQDLKKFWRGPFFGS